MSRFKSVVKNTFFNYVSYFTTAILSFILRTIFIYQLGITYLGVNELFNDILGLLSFTELGFGVFLNTCLYKPVSDKNEYEITAYMNFYKRVYHFIFAIILLIGLSLLPFLNYIVKDPGNIGNIKLYYILYLVDVAVGYLVSYQIGLLSAEQKNYLYICFNLIFTVITSIVQAIILIVYKNFLLYLLPKIFISIIQKIIQYVLFRKLYPFLFTQEAKKIQISKKQLSFIFKNIKAQVINKFSDRARTSTDSIILSVFINVTSVGLVGNYKRILYYIQHFINPFITESAPIFGNLIVNSNENHKYKIYRKYWLIAFWLFSLCGIEFVCLINPFIYFWLGEGKFIDDFTIILLTIDFVLGGQLYVYNIYKSAHGIFYDDYIHSLAAGMINLVFSILFVKIIGLPGVFLGTVITQLYDCIVRPSVSYKRVTGRGYSDYFTIWIKYIIIFVAIGSILFYVSKKCFIYVTFVKFIIFGLISFFAINIIYYIIFKNSFEYLELVDMMRTKTKNFVKKFR